MAEAPEVRPQVYFSRSPNEQNQAAKYLDTFNMPMICEKIKGTEPEVMQYLENLEKKRTEKWMAWTMVNNSSL